MLSLRSLQGLPFPPRSRPKQRATVAAFTLPELIISLLLVGILAAIALPQFSGSEDVAVRSTRDGLIGTARYAQQLAMADTSRGVQLVISSRAYGLRDSASYLQQPDGSGLYPLNVDSSVTISPAVSLSYSALGETTATTLIVSAGSHAESVCIEVSGYAHDC